MPTDCCYSFGRFILDTGRGALLRDGVEVKLRPKAYAALRLLVERQGQLVSKDELHQTVWGRTIVTDSSITKCMVELRRALGDAQQAVIRTIPRRGYILEIPVTRCESTDPLQPTDRMPTVAASPRVRWLGWAAAACLALIVGWIGWSARPGPAASAATAASQDSASPTSALNREAQWKLEQARFLHQRRGPGDVQRAEQLYTEAVSIDPRAARAWVGLAAVYLLRNFDGDIPDKVASAKMMEALDRALAIDPNLAEAHMRRGSLLEAIGEHEQARTEYARALELGPDDPMVLSTTAFRLAMQGRIDRAVALAERAVQVDPLSATNFRGLGGLLLAAGQYSQALEAFRSQSRLNTSIEFRRDPDVAKALLLSGRPEEVLEMIDGWPAGEPRDQALALVYFALGRRAESDAALEKLRRAGDAEAAVRIAEVQAYRGDADAAFAWIDRALERLAESDQSRERNCWTDQLRLSPFMARLHGDPRWNLWEHRS